MTTTYKVRVFSNGVILYEKSIRAERIGTASSGIIYLQKDGIDVFVGPINGTIIEKE
jgi:hypothetical protein